jgi:Mg-chelatase subunit ChlI
MNPEEGELRPQIADRIGLQVEVSSLADEAQRVEVMQRWETFRRNPLDFTDHYRASQAQLRQAIEQAVALLTSVSVPERLYGAIAQLTRKTEVSSHRADITILQCAKAMAALDGRTVVDVKDILEAATLALGHRVPYDPFVAGPQLDVSTLRRQLEDILEVQIEVKKKPTGMMGNSSR